MEIEFTVIGEPKHQQRHRTFRMGKKNVNVDPSKQQKEDFLWQAMNNRPEKPLTVPLYLHVEAYYSRPKNHYRTGKYSHILKDSAPYYKTSTPDADNIKKFVMDALNKVYWKDDSYVVAWSGFKVYTEETPKMIIKIKTIDHDKGKGKNNDIIKNEIPTLF